jgi:RNA polymerase sigma-70 factor (ECF subfamily)
MSGEVAYLLERVAQQGVERHLPPTEHARFDALMRRHHPRLRRFVRGLILDRARVDDVLQEAYVKAYRKLPASFANEAHELAWLHRVVYRCCLDEIKRVQRIRDEPILPRADVGDAHPQIVAEEAWRSLSERDRTVLLLIDLAGFDYAQVAKLLRLPRGTVASRLHHARERLREALDA